MKFRNRILALALALVLLLRPRSAAWAQAPEPTPVEGQNGAAFVSYGYASGPSRRPRSTT